jgi:hypothetical protein
VLAACVAGVYGMYAFSEKSVVNSIEVIKEGENKGKILISVATAPFASHKIIVKASDIKSILSMNNDDLGEDNLDNNVI